MAKVSPQVKSAACAIQASPTGHAVRAQGYLRVTPNYLGGSVRCGDSRGCTLREQRTGLLITAVVQRGSRHVAGGGRQKLQAWGSSCDVGASVEERCSLSLALRRRLIARHAAMTPPAATPATAARSIAVEVPVSASAGEGAGCAGAAGAVAVVVFGLGAD